MGLPMVQKDTRRRSSLILGVLLALLLAVAAGFFVLAVPIRMLETVTTFTRLSRLMVQAEPPISPSDRTLLAVLAGILTAGIGWVLVDWLLFGRAGMSRLIKPREDEYEDEDGDHFRPTDPLDFVSPVSLPVQEWAPPPSGDARRPLSARTDIGDPPKPAGPFGAPAMPQPGLDQPLNPFGQILPGVGMSAPPLHPNVPPSLHQPSLAVPPLAQQPAGGVWGAPDPVEPGAPLPTSWPPLDLPMPEPAMPVAGLTERATPSTPGWLPMPGVRPDGGQPRFDADEPGANDAASPQAEAPTPVTPPVIPQQSIEIAATTSEPQPFFAPPPLAFEPPVAPEPAVTPPAPPVVTAPSPAQPAPPPLAPLPEPGFDKARLEELLARLERGLQNRRAAAAAAAPRPAPPSQFVAPAPVNPRVEPPAAYAAPPPMPIHAQPVAAPPIFSIAPGQPQTSMPAPTLTPAAPSPLIPPPSGQAAAGARNDGMLDQPLHVTLDLLRSMVKR